VSGLKQRIVVWLLVACVGTALLQGPLAPPEGVPPVARPTTCTNKMQLEYHRDVHSFEVM
jgi:hypothetical protein